MEQSDPGVQRSYSGEGKAFFVGIRASGPSEADRSDGYGLYTQFGIQSRVLPVASNCKAQLGPCDTTAMFADKSSIPVYEGITLHVSEHIKILFFNRVSG